MNRPDDKQQDDLRLRAAAERQIDNVPLDEPVARPAEELLHELQVHQVELEMQNDALRQTQIALTELRDRYVDLFEFAPVGYITLGAEGMIEQINLTGATLLGRERNKLLRRDFSSLFIADDQPRWIRYFLDVKQGDGKGRVELALQRGDGTVFQGQLDCVREKGGALGLRITLIDTSERKAAEQAKLELMDFAMAIGNNVPGMLGYWDRELRCGFANRHYLEWFGRTSEQMQGIRIQEMQGKELFLKNEPHILAALRGKAQQFERTLVKPDGETGYTWAQYVPYWIGGKVQGFFSLVTDISRLKQEEALRASLEAQLRESQKMDALGTLAGGVAHDFNNALAAIIGNTERARQDVGSGHIALESLEEINKAARRAKDLVRQILAFCRRQPLERKPTTLSLVVLESARLVRATLPAGVSLKVECKADIPAVLADASQIKQILLNLVGNAIQAVQDQGRPGVVEVRLEAHSQAEVVDELKPGRYACLTVQDSGPGMDEATRARIFEPFFTTKPLGKGTGLGLSVVHGIVKAHEASIEVESTPGEGSAFHIYFPAVDASVAAATATAPAPAPAPAPANVQGKHILYIDDEEAIVFLMQRLLERQGYRVSTFTSPEKALAAARADPAQFDLAVTDYNMLGMSGLEVATALRDIRADLPVVLASGYITEELRAKAPAAGIRELIYKSDTVDELCEAVARIANAQSAKAIAS